ncbi:Tetratricopeptide repeat (TPR)-like superfamily protein, partial [Striga hermonthica]
VRHNIAIAENFQDGCSDPKRLIGALENILKQCEELADTSAEPSEITSSDGRKSMAGVKGPNNAGNHLSSSSGYSDDFDTSVAMFNLAVIWFHLHDYAKSFSYLETFYQNIEPIDEATALRICLLLLDVALVFHHASRSA